MSRKNNIRSILTDNKTDHDAIVSKLATSSGGGAM